MQIGLAIKAVRKRLNISQSELAERIEISNTSLSQIENGMSNPSPKTIKKICLVLEIPEPLLYILGIENADVPENKKEIYKLLFPSVHKLALDILSNESLDANSVLS